MTDGADIETAADAVVEVRHEGAVTAVFAAEGGPRASAVVAAMRDRLLDASRIENMAAAWRAGVSAAGDSILSAVLVVVRGAAVSAIHAGDFAVHAIDERGSRLIVRPHSNLDRTPLRVRTRGIGLPGQAARAELTEATRGNATTLAITSASVWAPLQDQLEQLLLGAPSARDVVARSTSIESALARATARVPRACAIVKLPDASDPSASTKIPVVAQRTARRAIRAVLARAVGARAAVIVGPRGCGKSTVLEQLGRIGMADASATTATTAQLRRDLKAGTAAGTIVVDRLLDVITSDQSLGLALAEAIDSRRLALVTSATPDDLAVIAASHKRLGTQLTRVELAAPTREEVLEIVRAWAPRFAAHHHVRIEPDAMFAAAELTERFSLGRVQPEAALFALEHACLRAGHVGIVTGTLTGRGGGTVDRAAVNAAIADLQGVPIEIIQGDELTRARELSPRLTARLFGQQNATARVAAALLRGVERKQRVPDDPKPITSLLLLGPTGTGKTETARLLAESWFADRHAITAVDLSEFGEPSSVYRLTGAPPGHVGYGERSPLAAALAANGRRVVLFDELEKACNEVHLLLLQILDAGRLTTSHGEILDFSKSVIVMTSNIDVDDQHVGFGHAAAEISDEALRKRLTKRLRPELVARIDEVVCYQKLTREAAVTIALGHFGRCAEALLASGRLDPAELPGLRRGLLATLANVDRQGGAREVLRCVERTLAEHRRPVEPTVAPTIVYPYLDGGRERFAAGLVVELAPGSEPGAVVDLILTHPAGTTLLYVAHDRSRIVAVLGGEGSASELARDLANAGRVRSAVGRVRGDITGRPVGELFERLFAAPV